MTQKYMTQVCFENFVSYSINFEFHNIKNKTTIDVVTHGSDYAPDGEKNLGYFRNFSSLLDDLDMEGNCALAGSAYKQNEMYPCIYDQLTFGYAITGPALSNDKEKPTMLYVNSTTEPNIRKGEPSSYYQGKVVIEGLRKGTKYDLYRWDSKYVRIQVKNTTAYDYKFTFISDGETYTYLDENLIWSSGMTVYRCFEA